MHAVTTQATKPHKRQPARTCVGCRAEDHPESMVRLVLGPDGGVVPDLAGRAFGRGGWVHATPKCLKEAAPRGLSRSFKTHVTTGATELRQLIAEAADRRAGGLIAAAKGAGRLAFGSNAVRDALEKGTARLVVVATDAKAAAETAWVERAVSDGRAVAWSTKQRLGELLNRPLSEIALKSASST